MDILPPGSGLVCPPGNGRVCVHLAQAGVSPPVLIPKGQMLPGLCWARCPPGQKGTNKQTNKQTNNPPKEKVEKVEPGCVGNKCPHHAARAPRSGEGSDPKGEKDHYGRDRQPRGFSPVVLDAEKEVDRHVMT